MKPIQKTQKPSNLLKTQTIPTPQIGTQSLLPKLFTPNTTQKHFKIKRKKPKRKSSKHLNRILSCCANSAFNPTLINNEFPVPTTTAGNQYRTLACRLSNKKIFVSWQDYDGVNTKRAFGIIMNEDGTRHTQYDFQIKTIENVNQNIPEVIDLIC